MTQVERGWGRGPSAEYDNLASTYRPLFERIRANAAERELGRILPHAEIRWLKDAGFTTLRISRDKGGAGVTLPELFALLIELSAADTNVTNALRSHVGFTEDILVSRSEVWRERWIERILDRQTVGSGSTEVGATRIGTFATTLSRQGDDLILNGRKFYTTGSLFAEWIAVFAQDGEQRDVTVLVPTSAAGVDIKDDWDGFGQALTASGTITFDNVAVDPHDIAPTDRRFLYSGAFYQLVHLASLAGIGRAAADDVATHVGQRKRVFSHGNDAVASADPQILQIVGRVRANAYAAGAIVLKAAEALQAVYDAIISNENKGSSDGDAAQQASNIAALEVNQAVGVITNLILESTNVLFDALTASSLGRPLALDRYWRNARALTTHNPRVYRERTVGNFAVNGEWPPSFYRVGLPPS